MQDEQWRNTVTRIEDTFHVLAHEVVHGDDVSGDTESIEFESPQGKMKLERVSTPRVTGKTALGSKRIGGDATVKYQYSSTEKVHRMTAYRWDEAAQAWSVFDLKGGLSHGE